MQLCHTTICVATHYNTLQHTAAHCSTLQHTATHCNTLQHTTTRCVWASNGGKGHRPSATVLCVLLCCSVFQCVAVSVVVCCSMLQCVTVCQVTVCCSVLRALQYDAAVSRLQTRRCSVLQCVSECRMQCIVTCTSGFIGHCTSCAPFFILRRRVLTSFNTVAESSAAR